MKMSCCRVWLVLAVLPLPVAAVPVQFFGGFLTGAAVNPPNASPGVGYVELTHDSAAHLLSVEVSFSGLTGALTGALIHCCTAPPTNSGVAITLIGFPVGVSSGTYSHDFDLTFSGTYSATFLSVFGGGTAAGAEEALLQALRGLQSYVALHTTVYPGGEIRAYLPVIFLDGFEDGHSQRWSLTMP